MKKQSFSILNSKEYRNFMKIFNNNITCSISKNKKKKKFSIKKSVIKKFY